MIYTTRTQLFPATLQMVNAFLHSKAELAQLLGVEIPDSWPWSETEGIFPWLKDQLKADPSLVGWLLYFIVHSEDNRLIGDLGLAGKPDAAGYVQTGYHIIPEYRQQGFATEVTQALFDWAFAQAEVNGIKAETLKDGFVSMRVLRKHGFQQSGETEETLVWTLAKEQWIPQ
jgi:ribosomal-protein-alanine N-acetyltransferase